VVCLFQAADLSNKRNCKENANYRSKLVFKLFTLRQQLITFNTGITELKQGHWRNSDYTKEFAKRHSPLLFEDLRVCDNLSYYPGPSKAFMGAIEAAYLTFSES
jgi:hypothetical protein